MMKKIGQEPLSTPKPAKDNPVNPSRELIETLDAVKETHLPFPPVQIGIEQKIQVTKYPQKTAEKASRNFQLASKHFPHKK